MVLQKNVIVSKQVKNMAAVLPFFFFIGKKAPFPAIRITEQPILLTKSKINRPSNKIGRAHV